MLVQVGDQRAVGRVAANAVEAHGIEALEDAPLLAVFGLAAVFVHKAGDFLETGDDAGFLVGVARCGDWLVVKFQFLGQRVNIVPVSCHRRLLPCVC